MCVISLVGDHYNDKWQQRDWYPPSPLPPTQPIVLVTITREEFEELKREVAEMKLLLLRAKKYDEDNGEPGCEKDEKVALLKKVAEAVGIDLSDVFAEKK